MVDAEVRRIVDKGYKQAKKILTDNLDDLHKLAKALLEYELLSGGEIKDLLAGKPIVRDVDDEPTDTPPKSSVPSGGGGLPQGA